MSFVTVAEKLRTAKPENVFEKIEKSFVLLKFQHIYSHQTGIIYSETRKNNRRTI